MPEPPRSERKTQDRVVALFTNPARVDSLGLPLLGRLEQARRQPRDRDYAPTGQPQGRGGYRGLP